ncbi:MAG: GGDEF domain-containing protein [Geobacteraceae bacterium]|nr:GGDEF domain-containing protein [Geobacteraceae bacterium]
MSKKISLFLFPASMLAAVYVLLPSLGEIPESWLQFLPHVTYIAMLAGMFLSLHFNKSRAFFVLLMLLLYYWQGFSSGDACWLPSRVRTAIDYLYPVNIALVCLMREKGLFSSAGRMRSVFLLIQLVLLVIFAKTGEAMVLNQVPLPGGRAFAAYPAMQGAALFLMGFCGVVVAILSCARASLIDSAFFGALVAVAMVRTLPLEGDAATAFLLAAGLILLLSVLQESHNMAYRDDLTGLLSRRALNEQLAGLARHYAIAMLDLDHFKRLNDSLGHDVGDQVLRMVAARIRKIGGGGKAYRYGGEEFTIVFQGRRAEDVLSHLEELRSSIASYQFLVRSPDRPDSLREGRRRRSDSGDSTPVSVTMSIGVAESSPHMRDPHDVMATADAALYRAKNRGRNRVGTAGRT